MSKKKKSNRPNVVSLEDKHRKAKESIQSNEIYQQTEEIIEKYDDFVNSEKFTTKSNVFLSGIRHVLSTVIFFFAMIIVLMITASAAASSSAYALQNFGILSDSILIVTTTSFVVSMSSALVFKVNLYSKIYKLLCKVIPDAKSKKKEK